jgi:hypothetical protein
MNNMNQWMIGYGNLADGHTFVGPFATRDAAIDYAAADMTAPWYVYELFAPDATIEGETA